MLLSSPHPNVMSRKSSPSESSKSESMRPAVRQPCFLDLAGYHENEKNWILVPEEGEKEKPGKDIGSSQTPYPNSESTR